MKIKKKIYSFTYCLPSGSVIVEFAVVLFIAITLVAGLWFLLWRQDTKQSINAAAYTAFNDRNLRLYTTDINGNTIRLTNANVDPLLLNSVTANFINRIKSGSSLTTSLASITCKVRLVYLNLTNGQVQNTMQFLPSTFTAVGSDDAIAVSAARNQAIQFKDSLLNQTILPPEALVIFKSDYQFTGSAAPPPNSIYFNWYAVFAWGCVARKNILLFSLDSIYAGIFVPKRNL